MMVLKILSITFAKNFKMYQLLKTGNKQFDCVYFYADKPDINFDSSTFQLSTISAMSLLLYLAYLVISFACTEAGILYPRVSETREQISLDGLWNFALTDPTNTTKGHDDAWYLRDLRAVDSLDVDLMPVPSSYNDIGTDGFGLRDHVGPVWYQRSFIVPKSWNGRRVWIRFSSACYAADVVSVFHK
jgi:hypothetical protein